MPPTTTQHRIGAVSALSGVPVSTLRVWEARYSAFQPLKTGGRHRLYTDDDVLRATLMRQLTELGHAISTLARLDARRLSDLLHGQRSSQLVQAAMARELRAVSLAVIGLPLAARVQSARFLEGLPGIALRVSDELPDLAAALSHAFDPLPDILLVRVNSLHEVVRQALQRLLDRHRFPHVIVLYSFGQEKVVEVLKHAGMIVRREPMGDDELAEVIRSLLLIDTRQPLDPDAPGVMIPPRRYSDQTLQRVAAIPSKVLCECPRHVAELIVQLAHFEQYSQECLNNGEEDARLHARLSAISGSARVLFERALDMVARHEGIALDPL